MNQRYEIEDTSDILSPALIVFQEILESNLDKMIAVAGNAGCLRPHCKTHKMREVARLELERSITKHKAATFAEAEMLADAGVPDILLAYNPIGPNIARARQFVRRFPDVVFSVTADNAGPIDALGNEMKSAGLSIHVLLDIDAGQHRTGLPIGRQAGELYQRLANTPGLRAGGLHVYDGHQHQSSRDERRTAVNEEWEKVAAFRDELLADGYAVPRLVCGGTASFPIYAEKEEPAIELSPGTCVFWDAGYDEMLPDFDFTPAALLLTRVISRPTVDRITLDLGYKAVAADPPAGRRLLFQDLPDAEQILQNEEHLVLQTPKAHEYKPGDELLAIPRHVCPTTALHKQVYVVADGRLIDRWDVVARDRQLTI